MPVEGLVFVYEKIPLGGTVNTSASAMLAWQMSP